MSNVLNDKLKAIQAEKNNKILPQNIAKGVTIFGIEGKSTVVDTATATAQASDIKVDKYAFMKGQKVKGAMPNNGAINITPSTLNQTIPLGYTSGGTVSGDSNLTSNNIKLGVSIFGVEGNLEPDKPDQTKTATPTTEEQVITPDTGYELASVTVEAVTNEIDENIIASNISAKTSILGVQGTAPVTFSTVEEMNEHTDYAEDTYAIVYGLSYIGTYRLDNGAWTQIGDKSEEQQVMDVLNNIDGTTEQMEGPGGTDEEISAVLDEILGEEV